VTAREMTALIIRGAADHAKLKDSEIARRAKIGKATMSNAIKTGRIRLDTLVRIIEACGLGFDIQLIGKYPRIPNKSRKRFDRIA
jgi:hypothetical protein